MEIQGYGPKEVARRTLKNVRPLVKQYANGFLNPKTPHIDQLLEEFYRYTNFVLTIALTQVNFLIFKQISIQIQL